MSDKLYNYMFCYNWSSNGRSGCGHHVVHARTKGFVNGNINKVKEIIKDEVSQGVGIPGKDSIKIIFTNIILLSHCTQEEYYKDF